MKEVSPEAYFDTIMLLVSARSSIVPMTIIELHLYAYLGCIIGLASGQPVSDWGYKFSITEEGFPFSANIEQARQVVEHMGLVSSDTSGRMWPNTAEISAEVNVLKPMKVFESREPMLKAAVDCALALPVGAIRQSVGLSPGLEVAIRRRQRTMLLDEDDIETIYDEYRLIDSVLEEGSPDLMEPAIIWLSSRISHDHRQYADA